MAGAIVRELDLLLIGKTGNGKSATGNSVLLRKAFRSESSFDSVTTTTASEVSKHKGRIIKVVDSPGVGDTRMDDLAKTDLVMRAMERAIATNVRGYHAFLLVIRFGGRFTQEDEDTIKFLKLIFGKDFVKHYCILVMTYGDNFEKQHEETGLTFPQWCEQQGGVFKTLYDECDQRAILFDNSTKDPEKKLAQLDQLIRLIDTLWTPGHRYRDENFMQAAEARERLMIEAKEPMIRDETMTETSLILQELHEIQLEEPKDQVEPLKELLERAEALVDSIKTQDKGTRALHQLLKTVESMKKMVEDEIRFCQRLASMKEKMTQEAMAEKQRMQKQLNTVQAQYNELRAGFDKGIVEQTIDVVTWPLRKVAQGFDAAGRWLLGK